MYASKAPSDSPADDLPPLVRECPLCKAPSRLMQQGARYYVTCSHTADKGPIGPLLECPLVIGIVPAGYSDTARGAIAFWQRTVDAIDRSNLPYWTSIVARLPALGISGEFSDKKS